MNVSVKSDLWVMPNQFSTHNVQWYFDEISSLILIHVFAIMKWAKRVKSNLLSNWWYHEFNRYHEYDIVVDSNLTCNILNLNNINMDISLVKGQDSCFQVRLPFSWRTSLEHCLLENILLSELHASRDSWFNNKNTRTNSFPESLTESIIISNHVYRQSFE